MLMSGHMGKQICQVIQNITNIFILAYQFKYMFSFDLQREDAIICFSSASARCVSYKPFSICRFVLHVSFTSLFRRVLVKTTTTTKNSHNSLFFLVLFAVSSNKIAPSSACNISVFGDENHKMEEETMCEQMKPGQCRKFQEVACALKRDRGTLEETISRLTKEKKMVEEERDRLRMNLGIPLEAP